VIAACFCIKPSGHAGRGLYTPTISAIRSCFVIDSILRPLQEVRQLGDVDRDAEGLHPTGINLGSDCVMWHLCYASRITVAAT
jgi:hypothetical protein